VYCIVCACASVRALFLCFREHTPFFFFFSGDGRPSYRVGQPLRLVHHDVAERRSRGAHAAGGEGGTAVCHSIFYLFYLCYMSQNEEAEELMRRVEKEVL